MLDDQTRVTVALHARRHQHSAQFACSLDHSQNTSTWRSAKLFPAKQASHGKSAQVAVVDEQAVEIQADPITLEPTAYEIPLPAHFPLGLGTKYLRFGN